MSDDPLQITEGPSIRNDLIGHSDVIQHIENALQSNSLTQGWMISGPSGIGKATLAYKIAKAVLTNSTSLETDPNLQGVHLVSQKAHPDLFIAEPLWDEKNDKHAKNISVDQIRELINFFHLTPSLASYRVAIIDTIESLNRNSANALLKILEEPPKNCLILVLANAPGQVLPTIRSRCRHLSLHKVSDGEIANFLMTEKGVDENTALRFAQLSEGRPGLAWNLSSQEGQAALTLADDFLNKLQQGKTIAPIAEKLAPKGAEDIWRDFQVILVQRLARASRNLILAKSNRLTEFSSACPNNLAQAWTDIQDLCRRGDAVNVNRQLLILQIGLIIQKAIKPN
ncbi:MAG: AAA family ATPase [bacterium]